jgi:hypothetical protein
MVTAALVAASLGETPGATESLRGQLERSDDGWTLAVTATGISAESASLAVHTISSAGEGRQLARATVLPTKDGLIQTTLSYEDDSSIVYLSVEWETADKTSKRIRTRVEGQPPPSSGGG